MSNTTFITRSDCSKMAFLEDLSTVAMRYTLSMIVRNLCLQFYVLCSRLSFCLISFHFLSRDPLEGTVPVETRDQWE